MADETLPDRGFRQLTMLLHPFPDKVIKKNPSGGGTYVKHSTVEQRMLDVLGPVDQTMVEIVRGHVAAKPPNPDGTSAKAKAGAPALEGAVVGVVLRLTVTVDGRQVVVEEIGDCEDPHNWPHDGARLKDAFSDAYKRCAMRLGVGLHLWSQEHFYLAKKLMDQDERAKAPTSEES